MTATRADAVRKVNALKAVAAPGSGATDAERTTASALAGKLTEMHGLDKPAEPALRSGLRIYIDDTDSITVNFNLMPSGAW